MEILVRQKDRDERLSGHFWLREFHCKCRYPDCKVTLVSRDLISLLEEVRALVIKLSGNDGFRLKITSGYRCVRHNDETPGAAEHSQHIVGKAADVLIPNEYHTKVASFVGKRGGVGFYEGRLHIDVRGSADRWGRDFTKIIA